MVSPSDQQAVDEHFCAEKVSLSLIETLLIAALPAENATAAVKNPSAGDLNQLCTNAWILAERAVAIGSDNISHIATLPIGPP